MAYRTILADPPWKYGDSLRQSEVVRSASDQYHTMPTDAICDFLKATLSPLGRRNPPAPEMPWAFTVDQEIADDAVLFLWVTNPFLLNGDGIKVCEAWGFEPKQLYTWVKGEVREDSIVGALGMGHYFRVDTEHLILATRGRAASLMMRHDVRNFTFVSPKGKHSEKPEEIYDMIETMVPGPYLELFARKRRDGWDSVGDELSLDIGAGSVTIG